MSVIVKDYTKQINSDFTVKASIFLRLMADHIVNNSEKNTPKNTGDLRRSVLKQVLGLNGKVEWRKKYAAIQELKQFKNYTTPGTGPHYAEDAVKKSVQDTNKVARNAGIIR